MNRTSVPSPTAVCQTEGADYSTYLLRLIEQEIHDLLVLDELGYVPFSKMDRLTRRVPYRILTPLRSLDHHGRTDE